jgi:hypothetical protein
MDIYFNTARLYTKNGQIIRAKFDAEAELIHFADFSRAVHGTFQAPTHTIFRTPGGLAQLVMNYYDRGDYIRSAESTDMLMVEGRDMNATVHEFQL